MNRTSSASASVADTNRLWINQTRLIRQWVCYKDAFDIDLVIETINEQNKQCDTCSRQKSKQWVCFNDTNETSAIECNESESEVSLLKWHRTTRVDLLIESINEWNRSRYTRVVDRNRNSESASMTTYSIQSRIFFYLHLLRFISIHDIDDNSKMICTENRMKRILYVSRQRMKHILYVWNHENMSWNSFIVEYLKLNRKSLLEWQE